VKKFKKFLGLAMLLLCAVVSFKIFSDNNIVSKAATIVNRMATPALNYAYADDTGEVTVSFKGVKNAQKYRVYRKTAKTSWRRIKDTTTTKIIDRTAKKNVTYYYTVRAIRYSKNKELLSSFVRNGIKSRNLNPAKPTVKSAKASSEGITVKWSATKNTTKYALYRRESGVKTWKRIATTTKTSSVDKNASFGKVYYYTVRAIRVFDRVEYYSPYNKTGIAGVSYYPAQPNVTLAIFKSNAAHVTWTKSNSASYYRVLRKTAGGSFEEIKTTTSTCLIDETAKDYCAYYYTVQAVNNEYGTNYYSAYNKNGLLMSRSTSDFKLENITLKFGKPVLKWNNYNNAEGYVIYRKRTNESDSTYVQIKNIKFKNITTYIDTDASKHTEYTYVVKPYFADVDNSNLYAIGTINTCDGESKTNVNPNPTKCPKKNTCEQKKDVCEPKATSKPTKENESAQQIFDNIYDEDTVNKKISVIGDSISTFSGYSSSNNYYPKGNVDSANEIWWKKAANSLGMDICKINALSGRRLTTTKTGNTSAVEKCTNVTSNGEEPDVIISFVGVNDFINGVELGRMSSSKVNLTSAVSSNTTKFVDAYCVMINKLRSNYPDAKIVICTLPTGCVDSKNKNGDSIATWNNQIKQVANAFGLNTIKFDKSNMSSANRSCATIDGIHPNSKGQEYLANRAVADLQHIF